MHLICVEKSERGGGSLQVTDSISSNASNTASTEEAIEEYENDEVKKIYDKLSLLEIGNLTEEELISKIREIFGSKLNDSTINKIKLLLYKESIICSRMILAETSNEDLEALREMLAGLRIKIELLDDLEELEEEQETEDSITTKNNLFFLLSDTGKVIALESLRKNVPRDYYPAFKELLLGLKEGKAKGLKKLRRYNYLELKDFKIRVIFDKLSNGNYAILDCFMKKVDTGISYRNNLVNRSNQYQRKKEYFLSKYTEEDFIKTHEGYLAEILSLLDSKALEGDEENVTRSI